MQVDEDAMMREFVHLSHTFRRAVSKGEKMGSAENVLAILSSHEDAMSEGLAERPFTQVELADVSGMRPQSLGPLLVQLEAEGCISRRTCEEDRRATLVSLTASGRARSSDVREEQRAFAKEAFSVLTQEERAAFFSAINKLNEALDPQS